MPCEDGLGCIGMCSQRQCSFGRRSCRRQAERAMWRARREFSRPRLGVLGGEGLFEGPWSKRAVGGMLEIRFFAWTLEAWTWTGGRCPVYGGAADLGGPEAAEGVRLGSSSTGLLAKVGARAAQVFVQVRAFAGVLRRPSGVSSASLGRLGSRSRVARALLGFARAPRRRRSGTEWAPPERRVGAHARAARMRAPLVCRSGSAWASLAHRLRVVAAPFEHRAGKARALSADPLDGFPPTSPLGRAQGQGRDFGSS